MTENLEKIRDENPRLFYQYEIERRKRIKSSWEEWGKEHNEKQEELKKLRKQKKEEN